jgi:threonylcarbamoyladenosine tRNA methylthiotransferase MtaB
VGYTVPLFGKEGKGEIFILIFMKIAIHTLGCKVNQSESAAIEGLLRQNDFEVVAEDSVPDVCIINTCTVTSKSDYQSRQLIRRAVKSGAKVIATGCYTQLRPDDLLTIDGLVLLIGNSEKSNIIDHIKKLSTKIGGASTVIDTPDSPLTCQPYSSGRSRAFLKIQDGCNFSCSYCTVPMARGRSRSLKPDDVMISVKQLVASGYREIVLTGIHIGSYGRDIRSGNSLIGIVQRIVSAFPDIRIRLSSIEPHEFDEDFIPLMKNGNLCRHLHIPLQSGSDRVLRLMNRRYSTREYAQLINRISTAYPDIAIGADIIAGFPGETDKDFHDTVKFINDLPLSYFHIFPYSKRPNTKAADVDGHIDAKVKKERVKKLLELGKNKKYDYMKRNIDTSLDVIVEKESGKCGYYKVLSDNYLKIDVKSDRLIPGRRLRVKVISLTEGTLRGEPID